MTDAYAAGLTDGEGCLSMDKHFCPRVDVGMTAKALPILRALERSYGGKVRKRREATERWDEAWSWTISSWPETVAFLQAVSPYLILKMEQARLILLAATIRDECPGRYGGSRANAVKWTPEARRRVESIRKRIMELNQKGPSEDHLTEGAIALLVGGEWVTPQLDLFSDLGYTPFSGDWPRSAMSRLGVVSELPTSVRLTAETDGSASPDFLLPTPSAQDSTPTDEFVDEVREHLDPEDPLHRLWLPGRKWMMQRTLSRVVPALVADGDDDEDALLPTPGAWLGRRPENATADPERAASRQHEGTRGKRSLELPDALAEAGIGPLLPTPVGSDARGLTDGDLREGGPSLREIDRLLPTPTTQDGENTASPSQRERNSEPLNVVAADAAEGKLLPTPTAGDAREPSDDPAPGPADAAQGIAWGVYEAAILRWERVLGREAPVPTDEKGRLAPAFVEWMLGYPEGWISAVDIPRTAQLRILGNSVQVDCGERVGDWLARLSLSGVI